MRLFGLTCVLSLLMIYCAKNSPEADLEREAPKYSSRDLLQLDREELSEKDTLSQRENEILKKNEEVRREKDSLYHNAEDAAMVNKQPQRAIQEKQATEHGKIVKDGYRVQVLATSSKNTALSIRRSLRKKGYGDVYLLSQLPLYKIRVGNCETRKEALRLRRRLIYAGYKDSWLVETKIEKKHQ